MKKYLKPILVVTGIVILGIALLLFFFVQDMKPENKEEEQAKVQAEQYLEENFKDEEFEIYDVLYDNMGNYGYFDYAAKVRNIEKDTDFLVYYNKDTKRMEDSYTIGLEEEKVKNEINPPIIEYIGSHFGDNVEASVDYSISTGKPEIKVRVSRSEQENDKKLFEDLVTYIKKDLGVEHATITMFYTVDGEEQIGYEEF